MTSFRVFHTYGISFHTRCIPYSIFHTGPYGIWSMDRKPADDGWRIAAQRAAQQLRACGGGTAPSTTSGPAPALAPEERKLMALETIAEAARLWIVSIIKIVRYIATANSICSSLTSRRRMGRTNRVGQGNKALKPPCSNWIVTLATDVS
jgi:hypothetical protein